jgi:hypothetical protein
MMVIKLPHHNHIVGVYLSMIVTLHAWWILNVAKSQVEWSIILLQKLILLKFCIRRENLRKYLICRLIFQILTSSCVASLCIFWSSQIGHYYDDELISLYNSTACGKPLCCELWHMLLVYSLVRQLDGLHIYSLIVRFIFSYGHKCWNNKGSEILLTNASNLDEESLSAWGAGTFSVWFNEVICPQGMLTPEKWSRAIW